MSEDLKITEELKLIRDHSIRAFTAGESSPGSRWYLVHVRCSCGEQFSNPAAASIESVGDAACQVFFGHLADVRERADG